MYISWFSYNPFFFFKMKFAYFFSIIQRHSEQSLGNCVEKEENGWYHDHDDDDHVFCTPPISLANLKFKKVSFFEENFDTQRNFLYDWIIQKQ